MLNRFKGVRVSILLTLLSVLVMSGLVLAMAGEPAVEKPASTLTAIHPSTLLAVVDDPDAWIYCLDMNPGEAKELLGDTKAVKLDVLFRRTLFPQQMKPGDYCPFLLVSRSGDTAKVVFPKSDESISVVSVEWCEKGWVVLNTESIR